MSFGRIHNDAAARTSKLRDKAKLFSVISLCIALTSTMALSNEIIAKAEAKSAITKSNTFKVDKNLLRVVPKEVIKKNRLDTINKRNNDKTKTKYKFTNAEKQMIYCLVQAESGGETIKGRKAVAQVIINRYNMSKKKNIKSIVINRKQFSCVSRSGAIIGGRPTRDTINAVNAVLNGEKVIPKDVVYYYAYKTLKNGCWASRNQKYVCTIGNHKFYSYKEK